MCQGAKWGVPSHHYYDEVLGLIQNKCVVLQFQSHTKHDILNPMEIQTRKRDILIALIPIIVLVAQQVVIIALLGSDALAGASQVALIASGGVAVAISILYYRTSWTKFEDAISASVHKVSSALIILLMIGALSSTWVLSGIVPYLIYIGVQAINPDYFLVTACVICALVSLMTGSSWTTIATIGIALMGIGEALGVPRGMVAGAIISGAYFGDKISPMSETTVLASSLAGVPLFTHIRYMLITTIPSMGLTLLIFFFLGFGEHGTAGVDIEIYRTTLASHFYFTPWLLIVPLLTGIMIARKTPAQIVLFLSTLMAGIVAIVAQPEILSKVAGSTISDARSIFLGLMQCIYGSTTYETGNSTIDTLVATNGMSGMLNTIYLILSAMCFGGCLTASGMLGHLTQAFTRFVHSRIGVVSSTVSSALMLNAIVADQYLTIILTSSIFKDSYEREGFEGRLLSRTVEDAGTVTSPIIPWNSCGMTQAAVLNTPTLTYLPFAFFNLLSPLMSVVIAIAGFKIYKAVRK